MLLRWKGTTSFHQGLLRLFCTFRAPSSQLSEQGKCPLGMRNLLCPSAFLPHLFEPCIPGMPALGAEPGVSTFHIPVFTRAHWIVTNDSSTMLQILNPEQNEKILTLLTQPIYFRLVHNECCTWLLPRSPLRKAIHFPDLLHNHQVKREALHWEIVHVGFYEVFLRHIYLLSLNR